MILITGNKGFIGQHLEAELKKRGLDFVGYDIKQYAFQDVCDLRNLEKIFNDEQITEVIHLAALAGVRNGNEYPDDYIKTNLLGTWNVIKMCEKYKVNHLVFYSSSSAYGEGFPPIKENDNCYPKSLYGITKLAGENMIKNADIMQKTIIVPFTVYGENGRKDEVVYRWLEQYKNGKPITVYGNGSSCRGYIYVKDLVKITADVLQKFNRKWNCRKFNIGGCEIIKLQDIINIFKENISDIKFKYMDMPKEDIYENYADTENAEKLLGFKTKIQFHKIIKKIIKKEL